jgi:hypothetical protein
VAADEQRKLASMLFRDDLPELACIVHGQCFPGNTAEFFNIVFDSRQLPRDSRLSLRVLLKKTGSRGDIKFKRSINDSRGGLPEHVMSGVQLRAFSDRVNAITTGLCLTCIREEHFVEGSCEHQQILKQCVKNDPLF